MKLLSRKSMRGVGIAALTLAAGAAQAHTGHGTASIFEGLAHPLGADHLLAMVAVGVWSVTALPARKAWWGPATFLLALVLSAALGAMGARVPYLEHAVSFSVVVLGLMLVLSGQKRPPSAGLGLVAMAAALHGLAHGAEAPDTGFTGYAAGFLMTTAVLHFAGVAAGLGTRRHLSGRTPWVIGGLGTLCSGAGVYLFSQL